MNNLKENLHHICARVASACEKTGRNPSDIAILAVSKKHPVERIRALHQLGQASFGENYVQEALAKMERVKLTDIEWHFIGPLQSNKTRVVAEHFQWVQSVDRIKILRRLSGQRPLSYPDLNICIQVNIDREPQKAGVMPELVKEIARAAMALPRLRLRGLMTIPQAASALHDPSGSYARMEALFHDLIEDGMELDTLSMGMSGDLEAAIMHGSTMVRIGTDLFGPRPDNGVN
jgi:pyridoxal phosphate enzyme (YggS family)